MEISGRSHPAAKNSEPAKRRQIQHDQPGGKKERHSEKNTCKEQPWSYIVRFIREWRFFIKEKCIAQPRRKLRQVPAAPDKQISPVTASQAIIEPKSEQAGHHRGKNGVQDAGVIHTGEAPKWVGSTDIKAAPEF